MRKREKKKTTKTLQHSFLIGYLYITGFQNERQFHLIYCLTELKLDPKENNMIEMKNISIFYSLSLSATYHSCWFYDERSVCFFLLLFIQNPRNIVGKLLKLKFRRLSHKRHVLGSHSWLLSQMSDNVWVERGEKKRLVWYARAAYQVFTILLLHFPLLKEYSYSPVIPLERAALYVDSE